MALCWCSRRGVKRTIGEPAAEGRLALADAGSLGEQARHQRPRQREQVLVCGQLAHDAIDGDAVEGRRAGERPRRAEQLLPRPVQAGRQSHGGRHISAGPAALLGGRRRGGWWCALGPLLRHAPAGARVAVAAALAAQARRPAAAGGQPATASPRRWRDRLGAREALAVVLERQAAAAGPGRT